MKKEKSKNDGSVNVLIMVIISLCVCVSAQHIVHLKHMIFYDIHDNNLKRIRYLKYLIIHLTKKIKDLQWKIQLNEIK